MAGIGFELKKLFQKKGVFALIRAYGYTGVITAGPMILGVLLLLVIATIGRLNGMHEHDQQLMISMITYSLFASLFLTSFFSMVNTRFIADMLYQEKNQLIMSSLMGSLCVLLPIGGLIYGIFLCFAGGNLLQSLLNFIFFIELVVQWMMMNYLSAVKNYKGIMIGFLAAIFVAGLVAWGMVQFITPSVSLFLFVVCLSYGIMILVDLFMLLDRFEVTYEQPFACLHWFDEFWELAWNGLLMTIGLFSHLIIAWFGEAGVHIQGLYYGAPQHDVPAMYAFLTILLTTVNFVASVEVNFYPYYRRYYDLFNGTGSVNEIKVAEKEMKHVLRNEVTYTARKQFYLTAAMVSIGVLILDRLPLGFNSLMNGYFRILCVGYGAYAIGNVMMLMLLYFADYSGALQASIFFALTTTVGSGLSLFFETRYYGFAFAIGAMVYMAYCQQRLNLYTTHLAFHILSSQPIIANPKNGIFTRFGRWMDRVFALRESGQK